MIGIMSRCGNIASLSMSMSGSFVSSFIRGLFLGF
jgi:hypothetical protein